MTEPIAELIARAPLAGGGDLPGDLAPRVRPH